MTRRHPGDIWRRVCYAGPMAVATACANIALVKYWGKRDAALNLPAAGSLSLTLDRLRTHTEVSIGADADTLVLEGRLIEGRPLSRVSEFLDLIRERAGSDAKALVRTTNAFAAAAGLASSASGFAALAVAAAKAYGLDATEAQLSELARRGSGSAARSIFGGYARMHEGSAANGEDAVAHAVKGAKLDLHAAISVVDAREKDVSSTEGMLRTERTSPYHERWIKLVNEDLDLAERYLTTGDFDALAEVVEGSCLAMHADAMAARPGIIYFKGATLWAIDRVREMRGRGVPVMFTIDAGPHVVAFTPEAYVDEVAANLIEHPEIHQVMTSAPGEAAHLVDAFPEAPS